MDQKEQLEKTEGDVETASMGSYEATENPEDFVTTPDKLKETLERFGVAVIRNVLNEKETNDMRSGLWDFVETITKNFEHPVSRSDPKTWKYFYDLLPKHGMLMQEWGVGQSQVAWDLRQNPKIVDIFASLWKTSDLLVSFDGASLSVPHEVTKRGYYRGNEWLHLDQRLSRPDFECVQSWVTAYDVNEGDATLTVLEGSHRFFKRFGDLNTDLRDSQNNDWLKLDETSMAWYKSQGCVVRDIQCPAGSMVFWDSRTVHSGKEALKHREKENFRGVVYLCYTPRKFAKTATLAKKRKAVEDLRTTNHWPHRPKLFPKSPRTYGKPLPPIAPTSPPRLSDLGRKLAGF